VKEMITTILDLADNLYFTALDDWCDDYVIMKQLSKNIAKALKDSSKDAQFLGNDPDREWEHLSRARAMYAVLPYDVDSSFYCNQICNYYTGHNRGTKAEKYFKYIIKCFLKTDGEDSVGHLIWEAKLCSVVDACWATE